ncbi:hypothetical protein [Candidatus Liberibacter asiaticus]|uniref:hypothetical protein n=1 Tax=Liberibacter asiaticus TaxID=34021 RepID=UPI0002D7F643|nr:hypothetical protein [Candidatus Liberibacter asiaticus]MBA2917722.1 hypothetical protein [Candidatus Liberibacter asiaticus]MBE2996843.1 hypothetical protein [Candidatus Liberibacter asiaticus]MCU7488571.1 hypothetical protein [Candidatus Liberibacter asiaticus]MCU7489606.1 hypothetical protein [Candidatus Liberibacter asiaticus]QMV54944.1 hypothetical protein HUE70_04200 [Candidatus Liberibacter asiaticus]
MDAGKLTSNINLTLTGITFNDKKIQELIREELRGCMTIKSGILSNRSAKIGVRD